jgi:hypothetical protein
MAHQGQPPAQPVRPTDRADWQKCIETELDSMNRRLSAIESRMLIVFYLVVILTVTTLITDANAAGKLLQAVLQVK